MEFRSTKTQKKPPMKTLCCIGAGYVGGPTMAVIAYKCSQIQVHVVDVDERRIEAWNSDRLPIFEPGLQEIMDKVRGVNLFFSTDVAGAIHRSEMIFIAVNTPTKDFGQLGGYDLSAYESVARTIAEYSEHSKIIVEKSTVPVTTADKMRFIIDANKKRSDIVMEVISNPEFLAEGTAIRDLEQPDRILIGGLDTDSGNSAVSALVWLYEHWVDKSKILTTGLYSAEIGKLASNAFLAQRISSINSLSALCELTGANISEVAKVIGTDKRIGNKFLNASVGFGGSCLEKDIKGLVYLCEYYKLPEVAEYWKQVIIMNNFQKERFAKNIQTTMFGNVKGKNICILGFAFKKDTGDIRESSAIHVCKFLVEEGAHLFVYDPKVLDTDITRIFPTASCNRDPYTAALHTHALVILTEWDEFRNLDYKRIFSRMKKPAFIFDGRNILDAEVLSEIGYKVCSIGMKI
eukprot:TRINITY_DN2448_c0_g1_i1.p1 TRINITY_DN2448_c0_g1~~TRINITY_DN2448_c0_g1_i1.p1  ORF type:complete len:462 (-),score=78.14 TRINITY_DN2448_c0_g1_i1:45-1430(-)